MGGCYPGDQRHGVRQCLRRPRTHVGLQTRPRCAHIQRLARFHRHEANLASLCIAGFMLSWQPDSKTQIVLSGAADEEDLLAFAASLH